MGFVFPFFLSSFYFNCNSTEASPTWSSALCSAASWHVLSTGSHSAGRCSLLPGTSSELATGELVNCTQVRGLRGEQACGPCQGEKAPSLLHRDSHPGVFPPFLHCTQGKSNTGMLQGHLSAKLVHCKSLDCPCIYLRPKDLSSNPDTTTNQLCDAEQTT